MRNGTIVDDSSNLQTYFFNHLFRQFNLVMKQLYFGTLAYFISVFGAYAQSGNALNFDGEDDEVDCGNDASLQITGSAITLEAMVKFDSFADAYYQGGIIVKEEDDDVNSGYMLRAGEAGVVNFTIGNGSWTEFKTAENTVTLDTWYHIAATFDGSTMKIYIDGELVDSLETTSTIGNAGTNLVIGNWSLGQGRNVDATIDEVRIWNITRTAEEIDTYKDQTLSVPTDGLVAYYQFDQGISKNDNSSVTTAIDATGVNTGTLNNFALTGSESNWIGEIVLSTTDESAENLAIYPNPCTNYVEVAGLKKSSKYVIYDIQGNEIKEGTITDSEKINTQQLKSGLYFLNVNNSTSKLLKQ